MTEDVRASQDQVEIERLSVCGVYSNPRAARVSQVLVEPHRLKPVLLAPESSGHPRLYCLQRGSGGIGRRASLRSWWPKGRGGSSPFFRTNINFHCAFFRNIIFATPLE